MTEANEKRSMRTSRKAIKVDCSVLSGKRVLMCEDHPLNRELTQHILLDQGMLVESAENGKVGLDMFISSETGYYDIILMDIQMPVMNGLEAARQIRGLQRGDAGNVPIVAITAEVFPHAVEQMREAGMAAQLSKPVAPQKLYETLAYYILEAQNTAGQKR